MDIALGVVTGFWNLRNHFMILEDIKNCEPQIKGATCF